MEELVLTLSERMLIDAAANGTSANFVTDSNPPDAAQGSNWGEERTIRAEVIRSLCLGRNPKWMLDPRGIRTIGARIVGTLDLEFATVPVPLYLLYCFIEKDLILSGGSAKTICLEGSHVHAVHADRVVIQGGLLLRHGFTAKGEVRLGAARIGGDLDCSGATLENPDGTALYAQELKTDNSVFLNNLNAKGGVSIGRAEISGALHCDGAVFINPKGTALHAERIRTKGDVFL